MLAIISPAKTQDYSPADFSIKPTKVLFKNEIKSLIRLLRNFEPHDLSALMSVSDKLAELNFQRFLDFNDNNYDLNNAKPALLTFKGDVYKGLSADDFSTADLEFAQDHLLILSGLYGVLRPLDLMQAYRLEMGIKLNNPQGKDLYAFWGDKITHKLNELMDTTGAKVLIDLASNEYMKAVNKDKLKASILKIDFKEFRGGQYKTIALLAKRARGMMARFIIKNQLNDPSLLMRFTDAGYRFDDTLSHDNHFVFVR